MTSLLTIPSENVRFANVPLIALEPEPFLNKKALSLSLVVKWEIFILYGNYETAIPLQKRRSVPSD